jgi:diaminohydroxyphosphoribosylaminopyrimidine deaminase / 5-amino-6-(5-phosphoribosylamino)uracil reductase
LQATQSHFPLATYGDDAVSTEYGYCAHMSEHEDWRWMELAIELAWQCPPSEGAYSVGAVIVGAEGSELARGFSREGGDPHVHAEEAALGKLIPGDSRLAGATVYSTLEPCSWRKSRPRSCTELILATRTAGAAEPAGISAAPGGPGVVRVVIAWREPSLFVADCQGAELLVRAGLDVVELPKLARLAKAPNLHLGV